MVLGLHSIPQCLAPNGRGSEKHEGTAECRLLIPHPLVMDSLKCLEQENLQGAVLWKVRVRLTFNASLTFFSWFCY
jgi:hypothetical protein